MRISEELRQLVVQTCLRALGYAPVIWLFGSRVDGPWHWLAKTQGVTLNDAA